MLEKINDPSDLKKLSIDQLPSLARDVRQLILDTVLENGGHLSSNLGVVETVIAMHYVFDVEKDKFIYDVGHQCYAHKILTDRKKDFASLRRFGGISGFPKREESKYDIANTGHSSTSLSIACGVARAAYLSGEDLEIVTLIGDGALTGGLSYEALNDADTIHKKQIIILNDNSMSISANVGSMAKYLMKLHSNDVYRSVKKNTVEVIDSLKIVDKDSAYKFLSNLKNSIKYFVQGGLPFEQYGFKYFGPIDGHNFDELISALKIAKDDTDSVIIHVVTEKGRGFTEAEENPSRYHGYSPVKSGGKSFSSVFGRKLCDMAHNDDKIVGITAAMASGTGLDVLQRELPERFCDVGIAEGHALCMSAGLAIGGYRPYVAVYSTFLQRGYDQVIHDICLQDLDVTICLDRAGIVPDDGETHQGIYDIAFLRAIPNICILAPKDTGELCDALDWSLNYKKPLVIRYPKANINENGEKSHPIVYGRWQVLKGEDAEVTLLCAGARAVREGLSAYGILKDKNLIVNVINCLFIKPLDTEFLDTVQGTVVTVEDDLIENGFGTAVLEYVNDNGIGCRVRRLGITDEMKMQGSEEELLRYYGLDGQGIAEYVERLNEA